MQGAPAASYSVVDLVAGASIETQAVVAICLLFSLVSWYIIGAKWWELSRLRRRRAEFDDAMGRTRSIAEREQAVTALAPSPFADTVRATAGFLSDLRAAMQRDGVARSGLSLTQLEALTMTLESSAGESVSRAGRMVPMLAIVAATSPLLGLFGTVLGIMRAFLGIANGGTSQISAVAPGIAEALITTAVGLGAAIPAVIAYNVFSARLDQMESELERLAQETIGALGREGKL